MTNILNLESGILGHSRNLLSRVKPIPRWVGIVSVYAAKLVGNFQVNPVRGETGNYCDVVKSARSSKDVNSPASENSIRFFKMLCGIVQMLAYIVRNTRVKCLIGKGKGVRNYSSALQRLIIMHAWISIYAVKLSERLEIVRGWIGRPCADLQNLTAAVIFDQGVKVCCSITSP